MSVGQALPELATVPWRARTDARWLRRWQRLWHAWTLLYTIPFLAAGIGMILLAPIAAPVALVAAAHAWIIPELYAHRGANVVRPKRSAAPPRAETVSVGLLGDLVGHEARALHAETGLVLERGQLGVWLVGPAGALLVRPGGRRVHCYCVRVNDPDLPSGDRIAHLLLALRADERGFTTVANLAFSGARWRVRRRLDPTLRPALDVAARSARGLDRRAMH
jgi:hypothetical protein